MNSPRPRIPRRSLHGVLLLDKPLGWSSNDALQKVKRLLRAEKAGHTGTLDPQATGLLPLCFGAATKFSQLGLEADKRYRATLKLGIKTSTGDAEGAVLETRVVSFSAAELECARASLLGSIEQVPPMHSALKHQGRALYDYARDGVEIAREPRRVTIHRLDIISWQAEVIEVDVVCSKGTYIRTLAEDLGERLGCGAHLSALRRTGSGSLNVEASYTLSALEALSEAQRDALLVPPDTLLAGSPEVRLSDDEAGRFLTGMRRRTDLADADLVRVYASQPGAFLGSAHIRAGELIPTRLLSPLEVAALQNCAPVDKRAADHISPWLEPQIALSASLTA